MATPAEIAAEQIASCRDARQARLNHERNRLAQEEKRTESLVHLDTIRGLASARLDADFSEADALQVIIEVAKARLGELC